MSVKIKYADIAPYAKENFVPSISDKASFINPDQLQIDNLNVANYANPCELYQTLLDGKAAVFPKTPTNESMGLWSSSISNEKGSFNVPPVLTLQTSGGRYVSPGLTLTFDTDNNIFCNDLNIKWYRDNSLIADMDFTPDVPTYFCKNEVDGYNKVVITFRKMNMPYNRLKLRSVDYGYITIFNANELTNVNLIQEIDPISENLIINVCDFTFQRENPNIEYSFQKRQPLSIYFDNELKATGFVDKSTRKGRDLWDIETIDYIGILDSIKFTGGIYKEKNAVELLKSILTQAKVPFRISDELLQQKISGYIPICTCREAITQICFAIGAVADTSNSDRLEIYVLPSSAVKHITKDRIHQGQAFTNNDKITEVQLTVHSYVKSGETNEVYKAADSGTGKNIFVEFSEPLYELSISNGQIISNGANYAVIDADANCILSGYKYTDDITVKSRQRPDLLANDIENIKSITDKTLVSFDNADKILNLCYEYITKNNYISLGIYETKEVIKYGTVRYGMVKYGENRFVEPVNVGEYITTETEYLGVLDGRIISERFNLNGGIILKECEMV
jgi:hypothetical protein